MYIHAYTSMWLCGKMDSTLDLLWYIWVHHYKNNCTNFIWFAYIYIIKYMLVYISLSITLEVKKINLVSTFWEQK